MNTKVKFTKLNPEAHIPTKGSDKAAGYDLYAVLEKNVEINPHETVKIGTGLSIQPPIGYFGAIFPRSGLATKQGLRPANCVGVVDADYRGEVIVALHNDTDEMMLIEPGERIAQIVIAPYITANFILSDSLDDTERGEGGFGSTGRK